MNFNFVKNLPLFLLLFFLLSCITKNQKKEKKESPKEYNKNQTTTQDSLAFELCKIYGLDQGIREREIFSNMNRQIILQIDSVVFKRTMFFLRQYGYPTKEVVGNENKKFECVNNAVWAVLLHNPKRIKEKENLEILLAEVDKGHLSYRNIATLLDKYIWAKNRGKKVLYGSDFGMPCIKQKKETQKARKKVGLPPLEDSLFVKCN